ncbi:MAG: Tryptophan synthase alpha chain, partial [Myxococcaceae bacterium]|nr:Tryptophan synthase alpha chain [Myxococcaceae bacterium]
ATACSDKVDDDCDGLVDCKDDDCRVELVCCMKTPGQESVETSCNDGINNDCDTSGADCFDSDCALDTNCCKPARSGETTEGLCTNGVDDDCDGLVDCNDPNCNRTVHCCRGYLRANGQTLQTSEAGYCTDAYDNDCDGLLNCADSADCPLKSCLIAVGPPVIDPGPVQASQ